MRPRNAFLLGLTGLLLAACGNQPDSRDTPVPNSVGADELAKVTLKVGDQKGGTKSYLAAAGLLDNLPYKVEWSTFTSGPPLLEAANAGAIDIGGVGNTPPIFAAAANSKVAIVSVQKGDVSSDALLVPKDSPLHTLDDLRGRTIAVAKGSSAHGVTLNILRKAKLSVDDVKLSFLQPADAFAAFTQGRVDAWSIWDPYTSQALLESGARVLIDGTGTIGGGRPNTEPGPDAITNGYSFLVAARSALGDAGKNTAIKDFVVRYAKALAFAKAHPDVRADAWAKETGLKPEVAKAAVDRGLDRAIPVDDAVIRSEQELADAFTDAKVLPGKVNFADFVDKRYGADLQDVINKGATG
jgi:sulfonate transport system substrate-binding protein